MNKQNLIIFKLKTFYNILKELEPITNLHVFEASNDKKCEELRNTLDNYIIVYSQKKTKYYESFQSRKISN